MVSTNYRSCLSRAYYAAYSRVTNELEKQGVVFPQDREGPNHPGMTGRGGIRRLIESNMQTPYEPQRLKLSEWIGRLYTLRIDADYRPSVAIDARDAREAISIMKNVFDLV